MPALLHGGFGEGFGRGLINREAQGQSAAQCKPFFDTFEVVAANPRRLKANDFFLAYEEKVAAAFEALGAAVVNTRGVARLFTVCNSADEAHLDSRLEVTADIFGGGLLRTEDEMDASSHATLGDACEQRADATSLDLQEIGDFVGELADALKPEAAS